MGSIDPLSEINEMAAQGKARIKLELPRQNQDWSFTLKGSVGAVTINVTLAKVWKKILLMRLMQNLIKLVLQQNLIVRLVIFLTEQGTDLIVIEDIEIEGEGIASEAGFYNMAVAEPR